MTQREAPPRLKGIDDDEDEEKTSVGAAPDAEAARAPARPAVGFGKFNTPTAFTPHQGHAVPGPASSGAHAAPSVPSGHAAQPAPSAQPAQPAQ
ncbi:MAG: hypothetical protein JWP97_3339, partial [Labilithrix sp.]|nr:hypothetical protein [Labilithrix sp.]